MLKKSSVKALFSCIAFTVTSHADAAPVLITQTIHGVSSPLSVDGSSQVVAGDWIFKILTDTAALDQHVSGTTGVFDATVTLTQSGLGLSNELVTNALYWWESTNNNALGFSGTLATGDPWIRIIAPTGSFGSTNAVDTIPTLSMDTDSDNRLHWLTPLQLQNGTTISGNVNNLTMSLAAASPAAPEPTSMALFGLTALGFGICFRQRRRDGEPLDEVEET